MSIPFISNVALTEVDSSGNLNDKAGTTKSKLPIQIFKLTAEVSGNLTLDNNTAHKKIILDTNGNDILNPIGSPITTNSSINLELKGDGNVQSTLKTFTSSVTDTSYTGTTTVTAANNSTVVVTAINRTADISESGGVAVASGFGGSFSTAKTIYVPVSELITMPSNPGTNTGFASSAATASMQELFTVVGGNSMTNLRDSGVSVTVDGTTYTSPTATVNIGTNNAEVHFGELHFTMVGSDKVRAFAAGSSVLSVSGLKIPNNTVAGGGRTIAFTNNLAISVVLTGADPFDSVTVTAGATNTQTRTTTDGSFSLTGTISGSDGSSRPYALKDMNDGTGSVNEDAYTGTKSVSAF